MYYTYMITNNINEKVYIGITNNFKERWLRHKSNSRACKDKKGKDTPLYSAMRKHGVDNFKFEVLEVFLDVESCQLFEVLYISLLKENNIPCYNIHEGGTIGFKMTKDNPKYKEWINKQVLASELRKQDNKKWYEWVEKLRKGRKGKKPALGMKHTKENRKLFSKISNDYWKDNKLYTENLLEDMFKLGHKEAKIKYGISTTHYYRLKKEYGIKSLSRSEAAKLGWKNIDK